METWDEIRDEIAGMLADGQPLEDVITKLEQRKNEMAKANLFKTMDELKKPKSMTNEEYLKSCTTEEFAKWIADNIKATIILTHGNREYTENITSEKWWLEWLKQPHNS